MEKVSNVIEAIPLLTQRIEVTSLNQFAYVTAITLIITARTENEKHRKTQHRQGKRRLDIQHESANKRSSCRY